MFAETSRRFCTYSLIKCSYANRNTFRWLVRWCDTCFVRCAAGKFLHNYDWKKNWHSEISLVNLFLILFFLFYFSSIEELKNLYNLLDSKILDSNNSLLKFFPISEFAQFYSSKLFCIFLEWWKISACLPKSVNLREITGRAWVAERASAQRKWRRRSDFCRRVDYIVWWIVCSWFAD